MKAYNGIHHPPDRKPVVDNTFTHARKRVEVITAVNNLWLALEEARGIDELRIGRESNKLATLHGLLTHSPSDHVRIVMAWRSFRLPVMIDGLSAAHERVVDAMEAFLSG